MRSVTSTFKRQDRGARTSQPEEWLTLELSSSALARKVKSWIAATRDRHRAEALYEPRFKRKHENRNHLESFLTKIAATRAGSYRRLLLAVGLIVLGAQGIARAQDSTPASGDLLTLERAIDLALHNNHGIKIAELQVERAGDDIAAAKTQRLPSMHWHTLVTGNLAENTVKVPNPLDHQFPGLGPFFALNPDRKPLALFGATVAVPVTQQYRIGLHINLERVTRNLEQAKLRQEQNETIDKVKKSYYSILQTSSALTSLREAIKSYHELDKVTGDYVIQQVALKADHLAVQTRLARAEFEELELNNRLATQKEQLNSMLGREVTAAFEVAGVPEFATSQADLTEARKVALERRPELQQAKLSIEQAILAKRIKKSEYIPDVTAGFVYLTARNTDAVIPRNFANLGVMVSWEIFDWGRKKHQIAEREKAVEQARNGLKETEDQVLIEVGDKLRKLQQSGQALHVAKLAEDSAKENLRVSTGKYKYQAVMLSDVLQSQASLAEASHEYQQALLAFWTARAEYEKALGEDK